MASTPDYFISAIRMNDAGCHIEYLATHKNLNGEVGEKQVMTRMQVVEAIKNFTTFKAIYAEGCDGWRIGQRVYIVHIHGCEFLKTAPDDTSDDNLDSLPIF